MPTIYVNGKKGKVLRHGETLVQMESANRVSATVLVGTGRNKIRKDLPLRALTCDGVPLDSPSVTIMPDAPANAPKRLVRREHSSGASRAT